MADNNSNNRSLPKWTVQLLAWVTGVGGIIADYGFDIMHGHNLPVAYYCVCVGIGFGVDPSFIVRLFVNFASAMKQSNDDKKE